MAAIDDEIKGILKDYNTAKGKGNLTSPILENDAIDELINYILAKFGDIKTLNGVSLLGGGNVVIGLPTYVLLAANFPSTIITEANVTGWNFAVEAGKSYRVEIIGSFQTAATTTGGELGFYLSGGATGTIAGFIEADIVNTNAATGLKQPIRAIGAADLAGSNAISTGVTAINSPHSIYSVVVFTCVLAGTFNVGWATAVAGSSAQLNANSLLSYQLLN